MKTYSSFYALALLLSTPVWLSCEKNVMNEDTSNPQEEINSKTRLTFKLFTPSPSRATCVQDFQKIWAVDVFNGEFEQIVEQDKKTADFGSPSLSLNPGTHDIFFFATDTENSQFNDGFMEQDPLGDTFFQKITLNTHEADGTQKIVIERQVAKIINEGKTPITVEGILTEFDLFKGLPKKNRKTVSIEPNNFIYTFTNPETVITLTNGIQVPVQKNGITVIKAEEDNVTPPIVPPETEIKIWENDTAIFYLAQKEIEVKNLTEIPDPRTTFQTEMMPYRMPTRLEALVLNKRTVPLNYWSGKRCLCYDHPLDANSQSHESNLGTGKYFSFKWNNGGAVTAAGSQTTYCIKPIRTLPLAPITPTFTVDADFTWGTDTTVVK